MWSRSLLVVKVFVLLITLPLMTMMMYRWLQNCSSELLRVHVHTYLNGPFVAVITGKSTINILPLLAMVLLLFIITSDSIWLASFEITGSMKQNAKMVHKYNYCMCFCVIL